MPSPDPSTNGDATPKPDLFEMSLEPVDPSELNIQEIPTVEVAVLPRAGFGFWKGVLWCLFFMLATQVAPGLIAVLAISFSKASSPDKLLQAVLDTATDERTMQL